jgi:hypothetical protein
VDVILSTLCRPGKVSFELSHQPAYHSSAKSALFAPSMIRAGGINFMMPAQSIDIT